MGQNILSTDVVKMGFVFMKLKISEYEDLSELTEALRSKHIMENEKKMIRSEGAVADYIREHCQLFIDVDTNQYFVFDNTLNKKLKITPEVFAFAHGYKTPDGRIAELAHTPYNPYEFYTKKDVYSEEMKRDVVMVNTHTFPVWRYLEVKDYDEELLKPIFNFLDHLFPEAEAQEYVLNWMRHMVYGRAATVLCLNSNKGTGKNLFVDLCGYLVGEVNYKKAPPKFLESSFNSVIEKTRLLFFDEQPMVTHEHEDNLKKLCNRTQTVHKKGKDANDTIEIYYSMILANNREIDLRLSFEDRRFSVPEMTNTPLLKVWDEERVTRFSEFIKDNEVLAHFARFLEACDFGFGDEIPWKGEKFKRICDMSMYEYERFIFDKLGNLVVNENIFEISFDDLSFEYKEQYRKPLSFRILAEFLKKKYQGDNFASLVPKGKGHLIVVDKGMVEKFKKYFKDAYGIGKGDRL